MSPVTPTGKPCGPTTAVYWVPRAEGHDPNTHVSHIYDNRTRIATRVRQLLTGYRFSQEPASPMRRLISNVEISRTDDGYEVGSNFMLMETVVQSTHELRIWAGRTTHRLRRSTASCAWPTRKWYWSTATRPSRRWPS